jgi:CheY-like chemotaxis protein
VSKPRILLVDDSVTIQKVVNLTFADQGMEVVAIGDSVTAIEQFDQTKPDLVLADVHMPGMSGYQLCELIRSDKANRDIPIVLLVGSFEPFDREEAIRVGASASITKPFSSIGELVSTVRQLIDESRSRAQSSPATPAPDTSDIDNLYQQSFVETVRLPEDLREEVEFVEFADNELDDETSTAKRRRRCTTPRKSYRHPRERTISRAKLRPLRRPLPIPTDPGPRVNRRARREQRNVRTMSSIRILISRQPAARRNRGRHRRKSGSPRTTKRKKCLRLLIRSPVRDRGILKSSRFLLKPTKIRMRNRPLLMCKPMIRKNLILLLLSPRSFLSRLSGPTIGRPGRRRLKVTMTSWSSRRLKRLDRYLRPNQNRAVGPWRCHPNSST